MFWRGGMSPTGYFNRDGWYGRGPLLGADTECNGDTCVIIASRLDQAQAKALYEKMKYATANKPECMGNVSDAAAAKIEKAVLGLEATAALTKSEADGIVRFGECVGEVPAPAPGTIPMAPQAPAVNPLLIGGAALAALAVLVALAS